MNSNDAVTYMMDNDAFSQWMGIELEEVEEGQVTLKMKVREEMLNGFYILHGGITFALADSAMAFAANSHGQLSVVTDAHIQFPNAAQSGEILIAKAKETHRSRKKAYYEVLIYRQEDQTIVAKYQGSTYITSKPNPPQS
jgi:acyl-CoA thioesterase